MGGAAGLPVFGLGLRLVLYSPARLSANVLLSVCSRASAEPLLFSQVHSSALRSSFGGFSLWRACSFFIGSLFGTALLWVGCTFGASSFVKDSPFDERSSFTGFSSFGAPSSFRLVSCFGEPSGLAHLPVSEPTGSSVKLLVSPVPPASVFLSLDWSPLLELVDPWSSLRRQRQAGLPAPNLITRGRSFGPLFLAAAPPASGGARAPPGVGVSLAFKLAGSHRRTRRLSFTP